MTRTKSVTMLEIQSFIRSELPNLLKKDFLSGRMVKEADVECACYFHLRHFIGEGKIWKVLARKHVPQTGHYIDLLIFKNEEPKIAIELKWAKKDIGQKDKHSLMSALEILGVNKSYWISVCPKNHSVDKADKEESEKYTFHKILVTSGFTKDQLKEWKAGIRKYRSGMSNGSGRKLKQIAAAI